MGTISKTYRKFNKTLICNSKYFAFAVLFFLTELLIAIFVHDNFIRPFLGDFLVVILLYCFIKSFLDLPVLKVSGFVLVFAFGIEWLQYISFIEKIGLAKSNIAKIILGNSFSWADILSYAAGIFCVVLMEFLIQKARFRKNRRLQSPDDHL